MLILIVEDNADNRTIFRTILEYAGHRVITAETGMAGLELASEHAPDLILLDIELPDISGVTVRRALTSNERTRAIPVFAITAHELAHVTEQSKGVVFDRVIRKPIEPRALVAAIAEWVSGRDTTGRPLDA